VKARSVCFGEIGLKQTEETLTFGR